MFRFGNLLVLIVVVAVASAFYDEGDLPFNQMLETLSEDQKSDFCRDFQKQEEGICMYDMTKDDCEAAANKLGQSFNGDSFGVSVWPSGCLWGAGLKQVWWNPKEDTGKNASPTKPLICKRQSSQQCFQESTAVTEAACGMEICRPGDWFSTCPAGKICGSGGCYSCAPGRHKCPRDSDFYFKTCENEKQCHSTGCVDASVTGVDQQTYLKDKQKCCPNPGQKIQSLKSVNRALKQALREALK